LNILILGSQGFIGSHLINYYLGKGFSVTGCDVVEFSTKHYSYHKVSILSPDFDSIFASQSFDICINASGSGNVSFSMHNPYSDFEANTLLVIKVLDTIRKYKPSCKFLHISSAAVYGNPKKLPIQEDDLLEPLSPYGYHKLMSEVICKEYCALYDLSIVIVRPFSIYGPGLRKQLFWDAFQKYLFNSNEVELWGTGKESRDFIYIDDVVKCFDIILLNANMKGEIYNIASGIEETIKESIDCLFKFLENPPIIKFNNQISEGNPLNWRADISKLTALGFTTSVSSKMGIERLANWLQSCSK